MIPVANPPVVHVANTTVVNTSQTSPTQPASPGAQSAGPAGARTAQPQAVVPGQPGLLAPIRPLAALPGAVGAPRPLGRPEGAPAPGAATLPERPLPAHPPATPGAHGTLGGSGTPVSHGQGSIGAPLPAASLPSPVQERATDSPKPVAGKPGIQVLPPTPPRRRQAAGSAIRGDCGACASPTEGAGRRRSRCNRSAEQNLDEPSGSSPGARPEHRSRRPRPSSRRRGLRLRLRPLKPERVRGVAGLDPRNLRPNARSRRPRWAARPRRSARPPRRDLRPPRSLPSRPSRSRRVRRPSKSPRGRRPRRSQPHRGQRFFPLFQDRLPRPSQPRQGPRLRPSWRGRLPPPMALAPRPAPPAVAPRPGPPPVAAAPRPAPAGAVKKCVLPNGQPCKH